MEIFWSKGYSNSTHFLYSYVAVRILRTYPHTIQVWGIVSFILLRVFHNLQQINGNQLHTFFLYLPTVWELYGNLKTTIKMGYLVDLAVALFGIMLIVNAFDNSGLLFIIFIIIGIVFVVKGASGFLGFFSDNVDDNNEE